jgi:hypothetical protein
MDRARRSKKRGGRACVVVESLKEWRGDGGGRVG